MENKRSISVRGNAISLEENNILHIMAAGNIDGAHASEYLEAMIALSHVAGGKVNNLIDMSNARTQSPEARETWKKWSEHPNCGKLALHGLSPVARVVATFAVGMFGNEQKKNTKFFTSKTDALAWLEKNPA